MAQQAQAGGAVASDPLTQLQQVVTELAQARQEILRQSRGLEDLRTQC